MKIALVEANLLFRNKIKKILENNLCCDIDLYSNIYSVVNSKLKYDLILSDIVTNGEVMLDYFKYNVKDTYIIFITNHKEYVYQAFMLNVIGFIIRDDLSSLVYKIKDLIAVLSESNFYIFNTMTSVIKIYEHEIIFFLYSYDELFLYTKNESKPMRINFRSMKELEKKINTFTLVRISRNYIVNIYNITKIIKNSHTICLCNGYCLKVSDRHWTELNNKFSTLK